jgi:hypothetical protein
MEETLKPCYMRSLCLARVGGFARSMDSPILMGTIEDLAVPVRGQPQTLKATLPSGSRHSPPGALSARAASP